MREIKFRFYPKNPATAFGKSIVKKIWQADIIDFDANEISNGSDIFYLDEVELMQYTGLKDKNWKEIYEGDIVETDWTMNFSTYDSWTGSRREIFRNETWFVWVLVGDEWEKRQPSSAYIWNNYTLWNISRSLTVIWNIYENPELLNK